MMMMMMMMMDDDDEDDDDLVADSKVENSVKGHRTTVIRAPLCIGGHDLGSW